MLFSYLFIIFHYIRVNKQNYVYFYKFKKCMLIRNLYLSTANANSQHHRKIFLMNLVQHLLSPLSSRKQQWQFPYQFRSSPQQISLLIQWNVLVYTKRVRNKQVYSQPASIISLKIQRQEYQKSPWRQKEKKR